MKLPNSRTAAPYMAGSSRRTAESDSLKLEEDLYRTCVPGNDPDRHFCVLVRTTSSPPGITVDDSRVTNTVFNGPGGFR